MSGSVRGDRAVAVSLLVAAFGALLLAGLPIGPSGPPRT
jgi:hypothetical protein